MKKTLKMKSDEMSELQVRKDKAEKKLADANREAELMREKLQRKLDDAHETLKRKEKEFEDTMDHLQKDLDSLENERLEIAKWDVITLNSICKSCNYFCYILHDFYNLAQFFQIYIFQP